MRLLIDEHYTDLIAHRLTQQGYDVTSVISEGLRGQPDDALLEESVRRQRALLTNNVRHFIPLLRRWSEDGHDHFGLVLTSDESMPGSRDAIGPFLDALRDLMDAHPEVGALRNRILWLR